MFSFKAGARVLVLAPHTDDVEICCGGTVSRLIRAGCVVKYVAFSDCPESVPAGLAKDTLNKEARSATEKLGIESANVEILNFPVRHFGAHRQEILEYLITVRAQFRPEAVFCPAQFDIHQDHKTISDESLRAFRGSAILGYEAPWNNFSMQHDLFIEMTEEDLKNKILALKCFKSQEFRSYFSEEYIRGIAMVRGQQSGYRFAEAFSVVRIRMQG